MLPYRYEIDIAQERIRDAVHAYSRAPTQANEQRVNIAMKLWRRVNGQPIALRCEEEMTQVESQQ